ncbi:hypothetical protein BIY24_09845 [Halobacteriovorax marinus]|uniref:hypothetical protein n=1 Tax=Halobacteriovorax marinus TaxID=97084 RepID=UPI000BC30A9E|nr:hypothetical protein [Halobacteriovorax marinus]ATH08241.1 hypothetical protein BIY24_09845 [Halobacteriovorax marinus]
MNSKVLITTLLLSSLSVSSTSASVIDDFIAKYMTKVFSSSHGEGLPLKVGELSEGVEYRNHFMETMGIEALERDGMTLYTGNNKGLGLVKKSNEDEPAFDLILSKNNFNSLVSWKNGKKFIKALKDYTKDNGCIPKITSTSHGWRSEGRTGEGHGLSGKSGFNGIYVDYEHGPEKIAKTGSRTFKDDLIKEIKKGKIKFCSSCIAQFYACNVSTYFADSFAKMSGCQTVVATGQNSPYFQERDADGGYTRIVNGSHYWKSAAGVWEERQTEEMTLNNERKASWYRSTPIRNSQNEVIDLVKENLGELYIAL